MRGAPSVTHTISPKIEYNHCAAKHLPRKFCLVTPSQDASACDSLWFQLEPHQSHFVGDLALLFIKTAGSLQSWLGWSSWQLYSCGLYKLQCGALSQSGTNTARKCKHNTGATVQVWGHQPWAPCCSWYWAWLYITDWPFDWHARKSLCVHRNCKVHSFSASYLRSTMHQSVFDRIIPKKEKKKKKFHICLFNVTCNIFVSKALSPYGLGTIANPAQSCHLLLWCCKSMLFSPEPR